MSAVLVPLGLGLVALALVDLTWTTVAGVGAVAPLSSHLVALAPLLEAARQRHLTYPVLHYFHSSNDESSAARSVTVLSQALELLRVGVAPHARPDAGALETVDRAVRSFVDTLATAYIHPRDREIPPPDLGALRAAGVPTTTDEEYRNRTAADRDRRRLLAGLLADQGRTVPP